MWIRSRGLGRRELKMDLREFALERDGPEVVLTGVTHAPVTWETNIRITPEDVGGLLRVALSPKMLGLGVRWALRIKSPPRAAPPPAWQRRGGASGLHARARQAGAPAADQEVDEDGGVDDPGDADGRGRARSPAARAELRGRPAGRAGR
jgi:hypothetical protein